MKVLFLTNLPSPYRVEFFSELGKRCELTVLYERRAASDRHAAWTLKGGDTYREIYLKGKTVGADNSFCPEVIRYLKADYDKIVVGMYSTYTAMIAIAYMRWKKIPYFISTDGGFVAQEGRAKAFIKRKLLSSAKAWLATGDAAVEYLEHYGARREDIYIYPFTSVSDKDILDRLLSSSEKEQLHKQLGLAGEKVVISVGQFIERKGYDVLMQAVPLLHTQAEFYIVGGTKGQLEELVGRPLPANVHAVDFLKREELFEYYRASDLFVLPTREDVWGLVVNEAMACGLPVVTTERCAAGTELIEEGANGYLVPVGDAERLADKIDQTLSAAYEHMGEKSLRIIKGYTFEKMAQRHVEIFERERWQSL